MRTFAVDTGYENSKGKSNSAWVSDDHFYGNFLESLLKKTVETMYKGLKVYIGFECPSYFDLYTKAVNKQRQNDNGRPWSASYAASSTVTGMTHHAYEF